MGHLAVGRVTRTAPRRIPRRHIARRGQPPRACPEVSSLFPSRRAVECPSGARTVAAVGSSPWSRPPTSTSLAAPAPSKPVGRVGARSHRCGSGPRISGRIAGHYSRRSASRTGAAARRSTFRCRRVTAGGSLCRSGSPIRPRIRCGGGSQPSLIGRPTGDIERRLGRWPPDRPAPSAPWPVPDRSRPAGGRLTECADCVRTQRPSAEVRTPRANRQGRRELGGLAPDARHRHACRAGSEMKRGAWLRRIDRWITYAISVVTE
jgi:hypothetical protein